MQDESEEVRAFIHKSTDTDDASEDSRIDWRWRGSFVTLLSQPAEQKLGGDSGERTRRRYGGEGNRVQAKS